MASPEGMVEEIAKLSVEQLRQVKEQVDNEVGVLQDSLANIRTAASRFEMASKALNTLSQQPAGACLFSLSVSLSPRRLVEKGTDCGRLSRFSCGCLRRCDCILCLCEFFYFYRGSYGNELIAFRFFEKVALGSLFIFNFLKLTFWGEDCRGERLDLGALKVTVCECVSVRNVGSWYCLIGVFLD